MITRREMLQTTGAVTAALFVPALPILADEAKKAEGFTLPKLPYATDALEAAIDAQTMEIHHGRHHKTYVDNLNKLVAGTDWATKSIEDILANLAKVPEKIRAGVRNNAGGHYNHSLFWQMMAKKGGEPSDAVKAAVKEAFGDDAGLKKQLKDAGLGRFGSGWAWVIVAKDGKLKIVSTPNQDNSLMDGSGVPILGVDVWEHAYYLRYQNKRADYLDNWFKVVNWEFVNDHYAKIKKG